MPAASDSRGLCADLIGLSAPAFERTVRWEDAAAYAAGTFDPNPRYLDDRDPARLVAPPIMAAALTASGNTEIGARILAASGLTSDDFARQVHYSEVIEFHQPLRPGMALSIHPAVAAIRPHRLGTELVLRFDATADGVPVFREHLGTLVQGMFGPQTGQGASLPDVPVVTTRLGTGEPDICAASGEDSYGEVDAHIYDRCSGISYPVHISAATAQRAGLDGPLVHGTAVLARSLRHLIDSRLGGDPTPIRRIAVRFAGMVLPGARVRTFVTPDHRFRAEDAHGRPILRDGLVELGR